MANLIQARGLFSYGSELTIPEGALVEADNVNVDESGVITPRRGLNDYGSPFSTQNIRLKQIAEYKGRLIRHYEDVLQFENSSNDFTSFSGSYSEIEPGFRIKYQEANKNFYFTTIEGIKKISAKSANDLPNIAITNAGGIKAIDLSAKILPTIGGFLPAESKVAYRVVWGTKDLNNNLILGSPSSRFVLSNTSSDIELQEKSTVTFSGMPTGGNYLLLSSTTTTYALWYQVSGTDVAPSESDTIGVTFVEVDFQGTTTNDQRALVLANAVAQIGEFETSVLSAATDITVTASGEAADIVEGVAGADANVAVTTTQQGSITAGTTANVEIKFSIPSAITTNYFYQIYRTAVTTAVEGLTLNEIDPGDEMNLVYEDGVTSTDISNGTITITDITTESFRINGNPLYTNPISGQGILQANERPPIAKDIALFRNSTFYANTKTAHTLQLNLLSVLGFTSGTSELIIGNGSTSRRYTFVGVPEIITITPDSNTNTASGSWINIYAANDEIQYFIWFDKTGSDSAPVHSSIENALGIRVDLSQYPDTANGSRDAIIDALLDIFDFVAQASGGDVQITNNNNGSTTDATLGNTSPGGAWAIAINQQGDGEDTATQDVLLSGLISVGQAIEETSRSLIKVINADTLSPVNAFYLSTADTLPGILYFEAKELIDDPFFIAVNDPAIQGAFNPTLPLLESVIDITFSSGSNSPANIQATGHGLFTGDELYIYSPDTTPDIFGKFTITVIDADNFTVPFNIVTEDNVGTNAFYFLAEVESDNLTKPNRLYYSKISQPEAVPIVNYMDIGPEDEPIERIIALRDNLFVLKTDGVYIVTGTSAPNFSSRLLDNSTNIAAPDSAVILNNQIFCLVSQGVATVTDGGVSIISSPIENRVLGVITSNFDFRLKIFGVGYESDKSYNIFMQSRNIDTVATQSYRYSVDEQTWSRWKVPATCGLIKKANDKLYLGDGTRNFLLEERKNNDRTDYSDRNYTRSITNDNVVENVYELSSVVDINLSDVIAQDQYVTIAMYNRLLRKLDIDSGLTDDDYESSLKMVPGDNITVKMGTLNTKLIADDSGGAITVKIFSADQETLQGQFNELIGELNDPACDTQLKNYKEVSGVYVYEGIIRKVDILTNTVETVYALPFVQGDLEIYKKIDTLVQWAPQHFGDPSSLKQFREGTVIFDQNNFYSCLLAYSSDLSPAFIENEFFGSGVGYFGDAEFGQQRQYWGGNGNDAPIRKIIPREKQRARYLNCRFKHSNAREGFRILGISAVVRSVSTRGYR